MTIREADDVALRAGRVPSTEQVRELGGHATSDRPRRVSVFCGTSGQDRRRW